MARKMTPAQRRAREELKQKLRQMAMLKAVAREAECLNLYDLMNGAVEGLQPLYHDVERLRGEAYPDGEEAPSGEGIPSPSKKGTPGMKLPDKLAALAPGEFFILPDPKRDMDRKIQSLKDKSPRVGKMVLEVRRIRYLDGDRLWPAVMITKKEDHNGRS